MINNQIFAVQNEDLKITALLKSEHVYAILIRDNSIVLFNNFTTQELVSHFKNEKEIKKALKEIAKSQGFKKINDLFISAIKKENNIDREILILPESIVYAEDFGEDNVKIVFDQSKTISLTVNTTMENIFSYYK